MVKFLTPKSKHPRDYDPHRKIQKIPPGESFNVEAADSKDAEILIENLALANLTEMPFFSETSRFFQVDVVTGTAGTTKLVARDPKTRRPLDHLEIQVVPAPARAEDMIYTGSRLTWFREGGDSMSFRATSGQLFSQTSESQKEIKRGPIPEGRYSFLAQKDPQNGGVASIVVDTPKNLELDKREGIQTIPHHGNLRYSWGAHRVRLMPFQVNARGGFYLHDSRKGYTSGCIEVHGLLFDELLKYASGGPKKTRLVLRVAYASAQTMTEGGTRDVGLSEDFKGQGTSGPTGR